MNVPTIASTPEKRAALERLLSSWVQDGLNARDNLENVWASNETIYRNDVKGPSQLVEGWSPFHVPLSQPRQDMLVAQVASVVTRQRPYMICDRGEDEVKSGKQDALHREWEKTNFDQCIQEAGVIATNTNLAIMRMVYSHDPTGLLSGDSLENIGKAGSVRYSGIQIDVIHPRNFICLPATTGGIANAYIVGHRFYRTAADVRELQRLGKYLKPSDGQSEIMGGDTPIEHDRGREYEHAGLTDDPAFRDEDGLVECWDVIVKLTSGPDLESTKPQRYYRATFAFNQSRMLSFEPYNYSRPWYWGFGFLVDPGKLWSGRSIARNLAPLQDAYNHVHTAIYNGSMCAAMPPVWGPPGSAEKATRYQFGDILETDGSVQPWSPGITFNPAPLQMQAANIERIADLVSRVSENAMGATTRGQTTATQTEIVSQGVQAGLQGYIETFTQSLPSMAAFTMELLADYYQLWAEENPDEAQSLPLPAIQDHSLWTTVGRSPSATPAARIASADQILQTALALLGAGQDVGIDFYELTRVIVENSELRGADKIQRTKEQMQMMQMQAGLLKSIPSFDEWMRMDVFGAGLKNQNIQGFQDQNKAKQFYNQMVDFHRRMNGQRK